MLQKKGHIFTNRIWLFTLSNDKLDQFGNKVCLVIVLDHKTGVTSVKKT